MEENLPYHQAMKEWKDHAQHSNYHIRNSDGLIGISCREKNKTQTPKRHKFSVHLFLNL